MANNIQLKTQGLDLVLEILRRERTDDSFYGDQLVSRINAVMPGFTAAYSFELATEELVRFAKELGTLQQNLGTEAIAQLRNFDSAIELTFKLLRTGQIQGEVRFRNPDTRAELSAEFEADQTYLMPLSNQIRAVLEDLAVKF